MSGIVGSYFNTRGSGVVAKLGTDGQVFTSTGAGLSQGFETAAGGGKINQVLQVLDTAVQSTTSTSFEDISNMTLDITPSAADSKILIMYNSSFGVSSVNAVFWTRLVQTISGGSAAYPYQGDASSSVARVVDAHYLQTTRHLIKKSFTFLDSPTTTSAITYKMQWKGEAYTFYSGRNGADEARTPASMQLLEVLA